MTLKQQCEGLQEKVENYRQRVEERDKKIKAAFEQVNILLRFLSSLISYSTALQHR